MPRSGRFRLAAPLVLLAAFVGLAVPVVGDDNETDTPVVQGAPWPFDSGTMWPGDVYQATVDAAGPYRYGCVPHPQMRGVVIVEGEPAAAQTVVHIGMRDLHFGLWDGADPASFEAGTRAHVAPGSTVVWTNLDKITHTVTSDINWGADDKTVPAAGPVAALVALGVVVALARRL